jgi:hypothetical protein
MTPRRPGYAANACHRKSPAMIERQRTKAPGLAAVADQDNSSRRLGLRGIWQINAGRIGTGRERGRRRTRQDQISAGALGPREIADLKIRTERRKLVSSAGPFFRRSELPDRTIQPFDLMSRRHPLSSTRAVFQNPLREANRPEGSCDVPASSRRQFFRSEIYFFFLATLRVFFAVFFTALFAFFAFLAFLAMLPS